MFNSNSEVGTHAGFLRMRPIAVAVLLAVGTSSAYLAPAYAADPVTQSAVRHYDLPAAPLAQTLNRIAREARLSLTFSAELIGNLNAVPVTGNYTAQQAIEQALIGTGLQLVTTPVGSLSLQKRSEVSSGDTTLPEVRVVGVLSDASEGTGSYAAAATTIGKSAQSLRETPQSVSVMTRQRLDDQGIRTMDEALMNSPGITVEHNSSYERTFYSRGFAIETIQYDGVPTQRSNGFAISPDLAAYDRVEILRGPAGLFNGAGQPGGTVNLVRKRTLPTQKVSAQVNAGSWNNYRAGVDLNLPLNEAGTLRGRIVGAYEDREYFYNVANSKRSLFYGIVEADVGPRTTLGVGINYEKNDMQPFYTGLPRFSDGRDLGLPRSAYLNAAWSQTNIEGTTVFADLTHSFGDDWKFKVALTRMKEDNYDSGGALFGAVNPTTMVGPTLSNFQAHLLGEQTGIDTNLQGSFSALGRKHDVLIGANYNKRTYDRYSQAYVVDTSAQNPYTFDPYKYANTPTVKTSASPTHTLALQEQSGVYGSLRFSLTDAIKLITGGRMSQWKTSTFNNITQAYSVRPYNERSKFTPFAALTYDLGDEWTVYGSYSEIFRSQANNFTATGERLEAVTGDNYEIGVKGALYGGRLNTSLALFRTIESNRSQTDPNFPTNCPFSPTNGACFIADGKVRSQGLDAEVSGAITSQWQLAAGYTFNQTKYLKDALANGSPSANQNQPISTFTPKHIVRVWSDYKFGQSLEGWSIGGGVNLQSKSYKTSGALRFGQSGYAVWSARVGYRINKNLNVALNVNNLFDKTYYRTLGSTTSGNWYGDPRNAMLTLNASF